MNEPTNSFRIPNELWDRLDQVMTSDYYTPDGRDPVDPDQRSMDPAQDGAVVASMNGSHASSGGQTVILADLVASTVSSQAKKLTHNLESSDLVIARQQARNIIAADTIRSRALNRKLLVDEEFRRRYLSAVIDPILISLEVGRTLPGCTFDSARQSFIFEQSVRSARSHFPELSVADAEIVAEKTCTRLRDAVQTRPQLLRDFAEGTNLGAYIKQIVRNLCLDQLNENRVRDQRARQALLFKHDPVELEQRRAVLDQAVTAAGLTTTEQRRFNMVRQDMTNVAIAEVEGVSEAAIRKSIKSAVARITAWLSQQQPSVVRDYPV